MVARPGPSSAHGCEEAPSPGRQRSREEGARFISPQSGSHLCRKWTNTTSEVVGVFSTRSYMALISFWSRKRNTRFFNWPLPFPGMISTSRTFFCTASVDDRPECPVDVAAPIVDIVAVECELTAVASLSPHARKGVPLSWCSNGACPHRCRWRRRVHSQRRVLRDGQMLCTVSGGIRIRCALADLAFLLAIFMMPRPRNYV